MSAGDGDEAAPDGRASTRLGRMQERLEGARVWARGSLPLADVVADAVDRDRRTAAGLIAGGLAYRMFLWIVPVGLVLSSGLSFWVGSDPRGLEEAARDVGLSAVAAESTRQAAAAEADRRWYSLIVGIALVVWFGGGVVRALRIAYAIPLGVRPPRLRNPILAGLGFTALVIAASAISFATAWARETAGALGLLLTILLVLPYIAAAAYGMSLLPHGPVRWTGLLPGAAVVAVGVELMHVVVALYLAPKLGRSTELYGALGAATVVLLWLYLLARLLVAGAFLNAALAERTERPRAPA